MLRFLLLMVCFTYLNFSIHAQSDGCSSATLLNVDATCSSPTSGTTIGATETIPGCTGNADDDVWYRFVATSTSHSIVVTPSAGMDAVVQLFSGTCSSLVSLVCRDNAFSGGVETINYSGLTIGTTYRIRVYHYGTGSGTGTFTICVTGAPSPPSNDNCGGAISLNVNAICTPVSGTLSGATQSLPGCSGVADEDVWYSFVATNSVQTITVSPTSNIDLVMNIYSGSTCSGLNALACVDNTFTGGTESIQLVGLTVGNVYRIRVYDYYIGNTGTFNICVTGTPTPAPTNDEPCNAIPIPTVTSECQYMEFTNVGATATMSAPTPASCAGGSGAQIGGFNASTADVWFAITVPPSGHINITNKPNMGAGSITDGVMALYSGTCGSLTQIACSDDYGYPGTVNDLKPMLNLSGLTPGSTVYLRYWGFSSATGSLGFCVTTATNDNCADALYICDLNGYSASTSAAFTPDRPGNMHGNNETIAGVNLVDGINSGGPFGYYPPSNIAGPYSSPAIDVNIENNSWIRFTASATTATLTVSISDCFVGNYPSGGIQMQIFSSNGCTNFTPISNFEENSTGFVITANGLTIGNDYILMVDGYAGDICNYTISANSGVQFPDIPDVPPICIGESVTLTAPAGADSYLWYHDGSTTQSVTVSPGTTQTYYCEVTGLCNYKQTLDVQVQVKPSPIIEFNHATNPTICSGQSITLTATGADAYLWNTGQTTASITVSPTTTTTYTIDGEIDDCLGSNSITVNVNPTPTVTINPSISGPICSGTSVTLTANGANSYLWSNGATTASITVSPTSTTNFSVVGTSNGCDANANYQVTVNPTPSVAITPSVAGAICSGGSVTLTASGATTYLWSNGATTASITVSPTSTTTFSVVGTSNGCTASASYQVIVNTTPIVNLTPSVTGPICSGTSVTLTANGANSYLWSNGATTASITVSPTSTTNFSVEGTSNGCTASASYQVTVNTTPIVAITPTIAGAICNGESVTLTASGATNYLWDTGATTTSITVSPTSTTVYSVTGTSNSCTANATYSVTVNALPVISGTAITTPSDCGTNTGSISGLVVTSAVSTSISWTNASNTVIGTTLDINNIPAGSYTLTVTDANGCEAQFGPVSIINPNAPNAPAVSANSNAVCENGTVTITATSQTGATFNWTGPNGFVSNDSQFTISNFTASNIGNYCATVTIAGCVSQPACVNITLQPDPTITISASGTGITICEGQTATLSVAGGITYTWTGPNSFSATGNSVQISNANNTSAGYYFVEGTDINGCSNEDSVLVSIANSPNLSIFADVATGVYCNNSSAVLTVVAENETQYNWTGPNFNQQGTSVTINNLNSTNTGWYSVTAIDNNNCSATDSIEITTTNPTASIDASNDGIICPGEPVQFSASGANSYTWTGPDGFITNDQSFILTNTTPAHTGWYVVTAIDTNNCPAEDSTYLIIEPSAECLIIPDLVTPNGDNLNDTWTIPGLEHFPNVNVEIYNRWGNLIYKTDSYQNDWNGEVNHGATIGSSGKVPVGTYFYILTLNDPDNTPPYKGYIEVQY